MEDRINRLELKITELENRLKEINFPVTEAINPEDLQVFRKVENQLKASSLYYFCYPCRPRFCWKCSLCLCPCGPGFCSHCGPCIASGSGAGADFSAFME